MKHKFNFNTQYHQFYISDKNSPGNTDSENFWTNDAYNDRLALEKGIVGVGTQCYGPIKGELDILDNENIDIDSNNYDHIVEGGIEVISDTLLITDCPNFNIEMKIKVNPGKYRVRVYSSNLNSVIDDAGNDYYKIELWPSLNMERKVIKRFVHQ